MTIQQLLLTSSKALFLCWKSYAMQTQEQEGVQEGLGKKCKDLNHVSKDFRMPPSLNLWSMLEEKTSKFLVQYFMLLLSPLFQTHYFTSWLAPPPVLSSKEHQRRLRLPAIMWNYEILLATFLVNVFWYALQLKSELKLKKKRYKSHTVKSNKHENTGKCKTSYMTILDNN